MAKHTVKIVFLNLLWSFTSHAQVDYSMCKTPFDKVASSTFQGCKIEWTDNGDKKNPYPLTVGFVHFPPYIFLNSQNRIDGILSSMFMNYIEKVCPSYNKVVLFLKQSEAIYTTDLIEKCTSSNCQFSLATVASPLANIVKGAPISKMHSVPGIAFVTLAVDQEQNIMKSFGATLKNVWPLFLLSMQVGYLAGVVVWLLERWKNAQDFPKPFCFGTYEAFWWSFISMTTVGYGDKAPISVFARIFSVFWILIGIALIGIITSILSTALSEATSNPLRKMTGLKVGCIDISPIARTTILANGGEPRCYTSIELLERDMALGYVHGMAMDTLEMEYYTKERFKKLDTKLYVYQETYTVAQMYFLAHYQMKNSKNGYESASTFQKCSEAYASENSEDQKIMESKFKQIKAELFDNAIFTESSSSDGVSILNPESPGVQAMLLWVGLIILFVVLFGVAFDVFNHFKKKKVDSNKGYEESATELARNTETSEERFITDIIERTLTSADEKLEATQKSIRMEIQDLAREIKREMKKKRIEPVFDRDRPPLYQAFPPPFNSTSFIRNNTLNNGDKKDNTSASKQNLAYQY